MSTGVTPVTITFDPSQINNHPFSFNGMNANNTPVQIPAVEALNLFVFDLQLAQTATGNLIFSSQPVPFPITLPYVLVSETQLVIVDLNPNTSSTPSAYPTNAVAIGFQVTILYNGQPHTSEDPSIMNAQIPPT